MFAQFSRNRFNEAIHGSAIGVTVETHLRAQHTHQAIVALNLRWRRAGIGCHRRKTRVDRGGCRCAHRVGLRRGASHNCIGPLCQSIGQQKFQATYLIASEAKACQVVALYPQAGTSDCRRQA